MKKLLIIVLAFILTACGAAPTEQPQPTPIVVTVVVPASPVPQEVLPQPTAVPTQVPPTAAPTEVPPTPQVIVVTATGNAVVSIPGPAASDIKFDDVLGKGAFTNMTASADMLTLRCTSREITFNITAVLPDITDAIMAYRIVDNPAGLYPSEWQSNIKMQKDGKGNFSIVFGGDDVDEDLRLDKAWLDVQFIGLNKGGGVVDRTQKIERMITYYKDCP